MNEHDEIDRQIGDAARTLHRDWDSAGLWPAIVKRLSTNEPRSWRLTAVAAALVLLVGSSGWLVWRARGSDVPTSSDGRLLDDEALAEIERAEEQYIRAIDELARRTAPQFELPASPAIESLRDRLAAIDEAIAAHRTEIARNPFNTHLRRQLLSIYQQKRRALEEVRDRDTNQL